MTILSVSSHDTPSEYKKSSLDKCNPILPGLHTLQQKVFPIDPVKLKSFASKNEIKTGPPHHNSNIDELPERKKSNLSKRGSNEGITDLNGNRIHLNSSSSETEVPRKYDFNRNLFKTSVLYVVGLCLFFSLLVTSSICYAYKSLVAFIMKAWTKGKLFPIPSGASCCWAVESGPFGASSPSNIVIAMKVKTSSDFSTLKDRTIKSLQKVIALRTNISSSSDTQEYYNPYDRLRFVIIQKFLLYCFKLHEGFNVERHVLVSKFSCACFDLDSALRKQCEYYLSEKLSCDIPQWRAHLIHSEENSGYYGIVLVVHHVYGDGISWLQFLRQIAVNKPVQVFIEPLKDARNNVNKTKSQDSLRESISSKIRSYLMTPHQMALQLTYIWREGNVFHKSSVKKKKTVRWTKLKLRDIKSACKKEGMTFTQVISLCSGSSFKTLFEKYSETSETIPSVIFAVSPFARFPYKNLRLINNFYACFTPIIVNREKNYLTESGTSPESFNEKDAKECNLRITRLCGNIIAPMQKFLGLSARSTMAFTNVPGMTEKMRLFESEDGPDEVEQICLIPPVKFRTGIVVGLFGYEDLIWLSICVDEVVTSDPGSFAEDFLKGFANGLAILNGS